MNKKSSRRHARIRRKRMMANNSRHHRSAHTASHSA